MKTTLISRYAVIICSIIFLASCSKGTIQPPASITNSITPTNATNSNNLIVINLVAANWTRNSDNSYSNTFVNLFQSQNLGSKIINKVSVFVVSEDGKELQIINRPPYLGGIIDETYDINDLKLFYYNGKNPLPFNSLKIKVVIETN